MSGYSGFKVVAVVLVICVAAAGRASARQAVDASTPIFVNGGSREDSTTHLDLVAASAEGDKLTILIARTGSAETARGLSRRRLQTARTHL